MPETLDEKQILGLKKLLNLLEPSALTKEEFLKSFENVIKQILEIERKLIERMDIKTKTTLDEIAQLEQEFADVIGQAKKESDSTFGGFRRRSIEAINSIFERNQVRQKLSEALSEVKNKIQEVDDKINEVKDGKDTDETKIVQDVLSKIPEPEKVILDTPEQIRDKIEELKGNERLEIKAINSLQEKLDELKDSIGRRPIFGGGVSKMSIDRHFIDDETPQNSGDNINFTIAHTPNPTTSLKLYRGGSRQRITEDYTLNNKTITLNTALQTGEILLCDYKK